jgi:thiamine-monophosphate kinase
MDLPEDELVAAIRKVLSGAGPEVLIGPGDDAAVVAAGDGQLVLTTDALVEGTHFLRSLSAPRDLGYKAIVVSVSDIAAMAASPRFALCALTLSDVVEAGWVMELFGGMREACEEHAVWLVGGNLARGSEITIAISVTGEVVPGRAVSRSGARVGDRVVVTGELGAPAAALRIVRSGSPPRGEAELAAVRRLERPTARVGEASVLAANGATAMIDLSDGLGLDLSRLCAASGVGASVSVEVVPVAAAATPEDALGGGEDYELLATLPDDEAVARTGSELRGVFGVSLTEIGRIIEEGLVAVGSDGRERPLETKGWDHFRARSE